MNQLQKQLNQTLESILKDPNEAKDVAVFAKRIRKLVLKVESWYSVFNLKPNYSNERDISGLKALSNALLEGKYESNNMLDAWLINYRENPKSAIDRLIDYSEPGLKWNIEFLSNNVVAIKDVLESVAAAGKPYLLLDLWK